METQHGLKFGRQVLSRADPLSGGGSPSLGVGMIYEHAATHQLMSNVCEFMRENFCPGSSWGATAVSHSGMADLMGVHLFRTTKAIMLRGEYIDVLIAAQGRC